ncbi:hypothetical protein M422DRAFT_239151 [Sphaerobolus stellatus SS14]|nr:hypothetical protein M422DRAFT_239151 [Sphaerobolus stellatus SS14]
MVHFRFLSAATFLALFTQILALLEPQGGLPIFICDLDSSRRNVSSDFEPLKKYLKLTEDTDNHLPLNQALLNSFAVKLSPLAPRTFAISFLKEVARLEPLAYR